MPFNFVTHETPGVLLDKGTVDVLPTTGVVAGDLYTMNGAQYFARVENDVVTWVAVGSGGGGITVETDPIYSADKASINTRLVALETATNISVDEKYNFLTRADADVYFGVHPDELVVGRMVLFDGGIWEWDGTDWKSAIEVIVGPKGEKGDDGYPFVPDYANLDTSIFMPAAGGTWVSEADGFALVGVVASSAADTGCVVVYINGNNAGTLWCNTPLAAQLIYGVSKGDEVKLQRVGSVSRNCYCYYIPPKAVVSHVANAYGMVPDYANRETTSRMSVGSPTWVADKDGFITLGFRAVTTSEVQVLIDSLGMYRETLSDGITSTITIPVAAGDAVTVTATGDGLSLLACLFIPPKVKPLDGFVETDPKYMADKPIIDAKQLQQDSRLTVLETATNVSVDQKYVFATEDDANAYFTQHPAELTENLMVMFDGSLWKYTTSGWQQAMEIVVGPKGDQGDPGYPYAPDYVNMSRVAYFGPTYIPPQATSIRVTWRATIDSFILVKSSGQVEGLASADAWDVRRTTYVNGILVDAVESVPMYGAAGSWVNANIASYLTPITEGDEVTVFLYNTGSKNIGTNQFTAEIYQIPPKAVVSNVATAYAMVPDYANKEAAQLMTVANPNYTADRAGFLTFYLRSATTSDFGVVVNGEVLYRVAAVTISGPLVQVSKGDVVSVNGALSDISCQYIPPKYMPLDAEGLATKAELQVVDDKFLFAVPGSGTVPTSLNMQTHAGNDIGYWNALQSAINKITANQAMLTEQQAKINDLLVRVAALESAPIDAPPVYDMSDPIVLHTPALLGLLGLEVGATGPLVTGPWTVPNDGKIVVDGAASIGLLTPTWIAVNGNNVAPSGSPTVLTLIGSGSSGEFVVHTGDVITQSGTGNVTYYAEVAQ